MYTSLCQKEQMNIIFLTYTGTSYFELLPFRSPIPVVCLLKVQHNSSVFYFKKNLRERETLICFSTYLFIHWLFGVWALTRDRTCNLGISGQLYNQLSYLTRANFSNVLSSLSTLLRNCPAGASGPQRS